MLSICIPVYNYHLTTLVNSLHGQASKLDIPFEIILADDASENRFRETNRKLDLLDHVDYMQLDKNIGRAKNRNLLADKASFEYLLFIDCDTNTPDSNFIEKYIPYFKDNGVVCGGTSYDKTKPDNKNMLRWHFGINREEKTAGKRNKNPNNSFMTNNFLISKSLFHKLRFNEKITGYGHEDTCFGYQLKKSGLVVTHINNPLIHAGLESSNIFLEKTREAIHNLLKVYALTGYDKEFMEMVSLLKTYSIFKKLKVAFFWCFVYSCFKSLMEKNLLSSKPKLWIFDFYKLGYICTVSSNSKK